MRVIVTLLVVSLSLVHLLEPRTSFAATSSEAAKNLVIRFGNQPGITTASIVKHFRWIEKQGYKVDWINFNDAGSEMRALVAGDLDVMLAGAAPEMILSSKYAGSWFVAAPVTNGNQLIVPVKSPIKTIQDLRSKRIAYPGPGSQQFALLSTALHDANMKPDELNLYKSAAPDMPSLLKRGEIDGFMAWTPFTSESVRAGVGRVLLNANDVFNKAGGKGQWISAGYLVSSKFAQEHPQAVVDVVKDIAKASRLIRTNQDEAVSALSAETGLSKETIAYAIDHKFAMFPSSIVPDHKVVQSMVKIFVSSGLIKGVDISKFVNRLVHPEFAQKAEAQLHRASPK
jgi:aliphatic sulfonates family ABC transporter substrate-binding protein